MNKLPLDGKKIAILATDGFEQSELFEPKMALIEAGACVDVVSIKNGEIKGWNKDNWGETCAADCEVYGAHAETYDALLLPGGVMNPDKLRNDEHAVRFVKEFVKAGKSIAAICHGPQLLINAGAVKGRKLTSFPSLQVDLENAGAIWVDETVVTDQGLVTSRKPSDIPAFNKKMIEEFSLGKNSIKGQISKSA